MILQTNLYYLIFFLFLFWPLSPLRELADKNEELEYYPIEKKHLGEAYTEYVDNNVQSESSGDYIVLNFYPEEITDLSYVIYNESSCSFHIYRGSTNKYVISWDYDTDGSYVEVQYMQNGFWYTINDQQHSGEYTLLANDGMGVRMRIQSGGVTVHRFNIREAGEE